jgi:hypothetical protein
MDSAGPVPGALVLRVTAQADTIGFRSRELLRREDLRGIASTIDVKTAIAVALLALHALLRVIRMLEVFGHVRVTGGACIRADWLCTHNLLVPLELRVAVNGAVHR